MNALSRFSSLLMQSVSDAILKQNPHSFVDIATTHDNYTLVEKDGTLVSIIEIDGARQSIIKEEFEIHLEKLELLFKNRISQGGHAFSWFFSYEVDGVIEEIERVYGKSAKETCERIGLINYEPLIDEQIKTYAESCHVERNFIVITTTINDISKQEHAYLNSKKKEFNKNTPVMVNAQHLYHPTKYYSNGHTSFVDSLQTDLNEIGLVASKLDVRRLLFEIRSSIDKPWTSLEWSPILLGDKYSLQLPEEDKEDFSFLGLPTLASQIMPRRFERVGADLLKVGGIYYAPVHVRRAPSDPTEFSELLKRIDTEGIPFRIRFDISDDGMGLFAFKLNLASIFSASKGTDNNNYLLGIYDQLKELKDNGETIVKLKICLCTWADSREIIEVRKAKLSKILQSWGGTEVAEAEGDAIESYMSTIPAATRRSIAPPAAAPLYESLKMLPIARYGSAWDTGSELYRTEDGKLIPYNAISSEQTSWLTLFLGKMGSGKSVAMNGSHWSLIQHPENQELPYISVLDIGPSSKWFIELMKSLLPPERKHEATAMTLLNTHEFSRNLLDTLLGMRTPLSFKREFIIDFYCLLCVNDETEKVPEGIKSLLGTIIDLAYSDSVDPIKAFRYKPGVYENVDFALKELSFEFDEFTTWYEIVDFLSENDEIQLAKLAQRQAVPYFETILDLCSDERIQEESVDLTVLNQPASKYLRRKLIEAKTAYPILANRTVYNVDDARLVSLDLNELAKSSGGRNKRKINTIYIFGLDAISSKFQMHEEYLKEMVNPQGCKFDYINYHAEVIKSLSRTKKRLALDEKHNVSGTHVDDILDKFALEARKWVIELQQASQLPRAFTATYKELATNIYILGAGTSQNIAEISQTFDLSPAMQFNLKHKLRRPSRRGATFLGIFETKAGWMQQLLVSSRGPTFLWSTNSRGEDRALRNSLVKEIGSESALKLLAECFPGGDIEKEIEVRMLAYKESEEDSSPMHVVDEIKQTLLQKYHAEKQLHA